MSLLVLDGKLACILASLYTHFLHFDSVVAGKVQEVVVISLQMPCGLYYCCHDYGGKNVNIYVAIGILMIVFGFILCGTMGDVSEHILEGGKF